MRVISIILVALLALGSIALLPHSLQAGTNLASRGYDATGKVAFGGVNIAGFDFGCKPWVGCDPFASDGSGANISLATAGTGEAQMKHFVNKGLNTFRLPVAWEYLADSPGRLNVERFNVYDELVQGCLRSGAKLCILDLHNYCRWRDSNGATRIVAQDGGPTKAEFAGFWGQLASKYANDARIAFDLMNEPHDLPYPVQVWADATKAAIDEIRRVGAKSNKIIITGSSWSSVWEFQGAQHDELFGPIMNVVDSDRTRDRLIIGLHQYVDGHGGTTPKCVDNPVISYQAFFVNAANKLAGRSAIISEIGGGNNEACVNIICPILDTINLRSEFIGVTMWAAGDWWSTYELLLTPSDNGQDQLLAARCLIPRVGGG